MLHTSFKSTDLTEKPLTTLSGHRESIRGIAYLPGGERVVSCSDDMTIRIWDVEKGKQEGTSMVHEAWIYGLAVTRDGKRILSGGDDRRIKVWDVETHQPIEDWTSHRGRILCIALSLDDQLVASGDDDGEIVIWEMKESGKIKHSIHADHGVYSLCFSPNGEKLACGVGNFSGGVGEHVVKVYDVKSGKVVLGPMKGHKNRVRCVLWSLDGIQLFSASNDLTIRKWDPKRAESIGEPWTGHAHYIYSLSLSPDGTKLVSASIDQTVRFWDIHSGAANPIEHSLQHEDHVYAVAFSPCGKFVASGQYNGKLSIWCVPWWDYSQQLQPPAVSVPKNQDQGELDSLHLPTGPRPITSSSSRPPAQAADATTSSIGATRIQRFPDTAWNLHDIRSNFAHDLTGYVVREGENPMTCGSFGDIYRGKLHLSESSIDVAVKAIKTYFADDADDAKKTKRLRRELKTWLKLDHINILPLFGTTMNFGRLPAMVCPWLENGPLTSFLERRHDTLNPVERLALISDAAAGLRYLHSQSIVHGDLSGSNVLVDGNGRACISDFGLSTLLTKLGGSTYATSSHVQGTLRWTAPELLDFQVPEDGDYVFPTPQSDVYSFGSILLQVLTGKVPYHYCIREAQVLSAILKGMIPTRPSRALVTDRQWTFMQRCWMPVDAGESRPCADELVEFAKQELVAIQKATL